MQGKQASALRDPKVKLILLLTAVIIILLIVLILNLPGELIEGDGPKDAKKLDSGRLLSGINLSGVQQSGIYPFGERILLLRRDQLALLNYQGQELAVEALNCQQPQAVVSGRFCLVGDMQSPSLFLLNQNGIVFRVNLDGGLAGACFGPEQHLAVIDEQPSGEAVVHLLALADGKRVFTLRFQESGHPLALSFTEDGRYLDVMILNTSNRNLQTVLKRFDLRGNPIAQRMPENQPYLFTDLTHDNQSNPVIYGASQLLALNFAGGTELFSREFSSLNQVITMGSNILTFTGFSGDIGRVFQINASGELRNLAEFEGFGTRPQLCGKRIVLTVGKRVKIFDAQKWELLSEFEVDVEPERIQALGQDDFALVFADSVSRYRLP